jgi:hypothetical protein
MTTAPFFARHRRTLFAAAGTALLHLIAVRWAANGLSAVPAPSPQAARPVEATLLAPAQPAPRAVQADMAARPAVRVKPKRKPAPPPAPAPMEEIAQSESTPAPAEPAAPPAAAPEAAVGDALAGIAAPADPASAQAGQEGAEPPAEQGAAIPTEVPPAPPAVATESPGEAGKADPAAPPPVYRVQPPPPVTMQMDVIANKNGTDWSGSGTLTLTRAGDAYRARLEASLNLLITKLNAIHYTSEGTIDSTGLVPRRSLEQVRNRAPVAIHFNPDSKRISFSASEQSFPWWPGSQDRISVLLQLAGIGRADHAQLERGVRILVGEKKGATLYRFVLEGKETIDTPLGRMEAWHLSRPAVPGSYSTRVDVWLAPDQYWLPVRIRHTEANGTVTTQTAKRITLNETGS